MLVLVPIMGVEEECGRGREKEVNVTCLRNRGESDRRPGSDFNIMQNANIYGVMAVV